MAGALRACELYEHARRLLRRALIARREQHQRPRREAEAGLHRLGDGLHKLGYELSKDLPNPKIASAPVYLDIENRELEPGLYYIASLFTYCRHFEPLIANSLSV